MLSMMVTTIPSLPISSHQTCHWPAELWPRDLCYWHVSNDIAKNTVQMFKALTTFPTLPSLTRHKLLCFVFVSINYENLFQSIPLSTLFYLNSILCHSCLHPWHPGNQHLKQLKWPNSKMLDAGNIETRTQSICPCQIPAA